MDVTSSKICKNECIDQSYNYCLVNNQYTLGICCDEPECSNKVDMCSKEAVNLKQMQYHACPKDNYCGPYKVYPLKDERQILLKPTESTEFIEGALCTYLI
jgi:hypothetical protein